MDEKKVHVVARPFTKTEREAHLDLGLRTKERENIESPFERP